MIIVPVSFNFLYFYRKPRYAFFVLSWIALLLCVRKNANTTFCRNHALYLGVGRGDGGNVWVVGGGGWGFGLGGDGIHISDPDRLLVPNMLSGVHIWTPCWLV